VINRIVKNGALENSYFERMAGSIGDKKKLIGFLPPVTSHYRPVILDVGAGGGELSHVLHEMGYEVYALDANEDALTRIRTNYPGVQTIQALANHVDDQDKKFDAIICSSILHEVFSAGDDVASFGHISSVGRALKSFRNALKDGGRLIIRDGVMPDNHRDIAFVEILDADESVVEDYLKISVFSNGTAHEDSGSIIRLNKVGTRLFQGSIRSVFEFVMTYNWGVSNYHREANEIYGVFTFSDYPKYVAQFGYELVYQDRYSLPEYEHHLKSRVKMMDEDMNEIPMFYTNAIWVYEKQ